ncbi:MAG: phosphonate ABC transporter, permease protein PhnE [Anaerolineaceae bacterium]|nr:phosphonate ABC transporter, permease protein PhnE [Anaerolineaceae bacterium]
MLWSGQGLIDLSKSLVESAESGTNVVATLVGALGNFLFTLGSLIDYGMALFAGLLCGFWATSTAINVSANVLKSLRGMPGYILGGVLGLLSGALLMMGVAFLGTTGALLTLIAPLVAAVLAGQIASQLYHRWLPAQIKTNGYVLVSTIFSLVVSILTFAVVFNMLGTSSSIVGGRLPADIPWFTVGGLVISEYVGTAGMIGAVLGALGGLLAGTHSTFPMGMVIYNTTRTILNVLRAIEPLIMGIVFVIWVGIGPFAGVLALTLHSIAALGKLYSEQIESIDEGPVEAITATGATRLQMIIYGVVPQIIPPYIAFTMYRWDINVRMSTIIGFVGGGGIGFLLQQQINLLRYSEAGVAVLAIAIVVTVLDYASATIRERLI